jgi:hypothetical protein
VLHFFFVSQKSKASDKKLRPLLYFTKFYKSSLYHNFSRCAACTYSDLSKSTVDLSRIWACLFHLFFLLSFFRIWLWGEWGIAGLCADEDERVLLRAFVFRMSLKTRLTCFPSVIYCYKNLWLWDEGAHGMKGAVWKKDDSTPKLWMKKLRLSAKTVMENETDLKRKRLLSSRRITP